MIGLPEPLALALGLMARFEPEFLGIVGLSLRVSLTAAAIAFLIALLPALMLAMHDFAGRRSLLIVINALQGLPPVVVGLVVYLLLSRAGPLGPLGLLFTPGGMVLAQVVLTLPLAMALQHRQFEAEWREVGDHLKIDGAGFATTLGVLVAMAKPAFATIFLTVFGRAIAEVGAIMIVGGNIRHHTRTMTTAIALETSKGDLALALALGIVLISVTVVVSVVALRLGRRSEAG